MSKSLKKDEERLSSDGRPDFLALAGALKS